MNHLCFDINDKPFFCSAGRYLSRVPSVHPKRTLDTAVLLLGYSGNYPISQDGTEKILSKGDFRILFPGHEHCGTAPSDAGQSHFWCHFYLPESCRITDGTEERDESCILIPEYGRAEDFEKCVVLFNQLMDEANAPGSPGMISRAVCDSYIKILLCTIAKSFRTGCDGVSKGTGRAATAKIKEYLRCNADSGISASEAARALGYNADHLCRIIKRDSGMTLSAYLNKLRLEKAKNLLVGSSMKISEIAYACGFSDDKYFMKLFSKQENITPTEYRETHFRVHYNY